MARKSIPVHWDGGVIRVVIADDHTVIRQALAMLLEQQEGIEIVSTVANGREALLAAEQLKPHAILMDLFMPSMGGVEATNQIKRYVPGTKVLMLSGNFQDDQVLDSLRAGADGYLAKNASIEELYEALHAVVNGRRYFSKELLDSLDIASLERRARERVPRSGVELLTQREREVLQLIGEGRSNQQIADELSVSIKTVEAHRSHLRDKLRARNRRDLIVAAMRAGLVEDVGGISTTDPASDRSA